MLTIGDKIPEINAIIEGNLLYKFPNNDGKNLVLYFYPKDDTPGCTKEAISFSEQSSVFEAENTIIIGVSRDSVTKHEKFICKYDLQINLISDEDGTLCNIFGTWIEKKMYGKVYMGVERATYLINADGTIINIWRKVRVEGHAHEVLEEVRAINK